MTREGFLADLRLAVRHLHGALRAAIHCGRPHSGGPGIRRPRRRRGQ